MNGRSVEWMVDTGAVRSVCGSVMAMKCGLVPSGKRVQLVGVGSQVGWVSKPVRVEWAGRHCDVLVCVVEQSDFPALLGIRELHQLRVVVRPQLMEVSAFVCAEENFVAKQVAQHREVDVATGVDSTMTDKELVNSKLMELRKCVSEDLTDSQSSEVLALFSKWVKAWLRPQGGQVNVSTAQFQVVGRPFKDKLRPLSPAMREELKKQVTSMLKSGIIRPSKSEWGSVPVFVRKKDGGWRMAIDYRGVNRQLKSDSYPLPLVWDNIQSVAGYRYYTCLDGHWGFWNIPLNPSSMEVTALLTPFGSFEFTVLPFGIKNSPAEFQRSMDIIFGDLYYRGVLCYIDDIVIYTNTWEEHLVLLGEVLGRCVKSGLFLKVTKSHIAKEEVPLLGCFVGRHGIRPNPDKVSAVRKAVPPKNKHELMSFLGTVGYLRRFVPFFSEVSKPLTDLCCERVSWVWSIKCDTAFATLKELLAETVLLSAPCGSGTFVIICDASNQALGAALCQIQSGELCLLEFGSKKLSPAELNW
eukprot:Lankesteria_metandrocarpae@DN5493_c2_g1_i2.p1